MYILLRFKQKVSTYKVLPISIESCHRYSFIIFAIRCCRIFSAASKNCVNNNSKLTLPNINVADDKPRPFRMFHDDTMKSFFRRLTFTPDGQLLIVPAGCIEQSGETTINTTYVFTRSSLSKYVSLTMPLNVLPYTITYKSNNQSSEQVKEEW